MIAEISPRAARLAALFTALTSLACGTEGAGILRVHLEGDAGSPAAYRVIAAGPDGAVHALGCPGAARSGPLRCSEDGVLVEDATPDLELTIKARGATFETKRVSAEDVQRGTLRVRLRALPAFEVTSDYRTGLEQTDGESAFLDLAITSTTELGPAHSVKFFVTGLNTKPVVYLQNTRRFPLHYDFARLALGFSQTRDRFARATYSGEDRDQLAGTLVYYPELRFPRKESGEELRAPLSFEFFPSDDLSPELALRAHRLLEERVEWAELAGAEHRLTYVPAGSVQERAARGAQAGFSARGALWAEHTELYAGVEEQILNPGLAYGTLRLLSPEALERTAVSYRDIVILTRLPNELPLVGGTITHELQTPLAHVNLAARARGTPNIAIRGAETDPRVAPLLAKLVRFEVRADGFSLEQATLEEAEAFYRSLERPRLEPEADVEFSGLPGFEELAFADALRVGVKAANLAELRRLLGPRAPEGFAVPFSAYHAYMSENRVTAEHCTAARTDCEAEGRSPALCDAASSRCDLAATTDESFYGLADRLLADPELAVDTGLREASLDGLRHLVRHGRVDPGFAAALDARVEELFGAAQVRLRSSTNAEDLPGFSGAGLYESVSAELGSDRLPSSRIREVWASVWLWPAFEERQFWNIDQAAVRMAVAVHPSVDDEAANGVLVTRNLLAPGSPGHYVNVQFGEVEVANPENGAVPEIFSIVPGPNQSVQIVRQRFSSLSPDAPLLTDPELVLLGDAADRVQAHFAPLYDIPVNELALDLEFKFHGPERRLSIKQARPYSHPARVGP